jgi:hypothetical protein
MSQISVNDITSLDGKSGPVISGITTVSSTGYMMIPVGDTRTRIVLPNENIVTDGLVLYLDAGKAESFGGDGTTWRDLSGENNNGTLTNGVGFTEDYGGSLIFDGVDDYVSGNPPYIPSQFEPLTLSAWIYNAGQSGNRGILGIVNLSSQPTGSSRMITIRSTGATYLWGNSADFNPSNFISEVNSWTYTVFTIDSEKRVTAYKNGIFNEDGIVSSLSDVAATSYDVGSRRYFGEYFKGKIAQVSIYNKALTASEVLQNYNATKYRYEN